jgi:hypothetical protein
MKEAIKLLTRAINGTERFIADEEAEVKRCAKRLNEHKAELATMREQVADYRAALALIEHGY